MTSTRVRNIYFDKSNNNMWVVFETLLNHVIQKTNNTIQRNLTPKNFARNFFFFLPRFMIASPISTSWQVLHSGGTLKHSPPKARGRQLPERIEENLKKLYITRRITITTYLLQLQVSWDPHTQCNTDHWG